MAIEIVAFTAEHIDTIVTAFAAVDWVKPRATFEQYFSEQERGARKIWVAYYNGQFSAYVTLSWSSRYQPFKEHNIPEIMDLNVLPQFRAKGIGSALLLKAEEEALKTHTVIGLGVGLYADYGAAQRLYIRRGYIPDGRGITYNYHFVEPGSSTILDDDLVLWFTKKK